MKGEMNMKETFVPALAEFILFRSVDVIAFSHDAVDVPGEDKE